MNRKLLLWLGAGGIALGVIVALVSKQAAERAATAEEFAAAFAGYRLDADPNYTGVWIGVVIAAVGAVSLLLYLYGRGDDKKAPPLPE